MASYRPFERKRPGGAREEAASKWSTDYHGRNFQPNGARSAGDKKAGRSKNGCRATVGFLAQCNYPPGIDGNSPGPFNGQQEMFSGLLGNHCNPAAITLNPAPMPNPSLPNGITIFS